jgi:hypothetical protein
VTVRPIPRETRSTCQQGARGAIAVPDVLRAGIALMRPIPRDGRSRCHRGIGSAIAATEGLRAGIATDQRSSLSIRMTFAAAEEHRDGRR